MVPNSSQTKSPQKESKKPATQSNTEAPTDPTDPRMLDGVENIPVPIIRPMLCADLVRVKNKGKTKRSEYISMVQLNTPKWRPIPPAVSDIDVCQQKIDLERAQSQPRRTLLKREPAGVDISQVCNMPNFSCWRAEVVAIFSVRNVC
jgi:hypothetical protein